MSARELQGCLYGFQEFQTRTGHTHTHTILRPIISQPLITVDCMQHVLFHLNPKSPQHISCIIVSYPDKTVCEL